MRGVFRHENKNKNEQNPKGKLSDPKRVSRCKVFNTTEQRPNIDNSERNFGYKKLCFFEAVHWNGQRFFVN